MKAKETFDQDCPATEVVRCCPLCGGSKSAFLFETHDRLHRLPGSFGLVCCLDCHLVRLSPRPVLKQLSYYYPADEYYSYRLPVNVVTMATSSGITTRFRNVIRNSILDSMGYPAPPLSVWVRALRPIFRGLFKHRIPYGYGERFPCYKPGGHALEIGCGSGAFLNALKHHGWAVSGVELSRRAAEGARDKFDIDVFTGELKDAPFTHASFDYIHMSHVIEHVADPLELLQRVNGLLKPGGIGYIETPNIDSFNCRRCGPHWLHWDSPRHLCLFTPSTLKRAVILSGLRVMRMKTVVEGHYAWADVYRREAQEQRQLPDRPRFPDRPRLRPGARLRALLLGTAGKLSQFVKPLNGDVLCCWVTK